MPVLNEGGVRGGGGGKEERERERA